MGLARLLWIDLCSQSAPSGLFHLVATNHEAARVDLLESIAEAIRQLRPQLVCIEFDYPDEARLQAVAVVKRTAPTLPLLMFTDYHSEALAVWAFRSGVWDYRVKPITSGTLARSIEVLFTNIELGAQTQLHGTRLPTDLIEPAGHLQRPPSISRKTGMAVAWIAQHFDQDLKRDALAYICHLSPSEFSHAFRREQSTTFAHFLLAYRISKARDFLAKPNTTISQAAYAAGFNDASYFSRAFRRLAGLTASEYQRRVQLPTFVPTLRPDDRIRATLSRSPAALS